MLMKTLLAGQRFQYLNTDCTCDASALLTVGEAHLHFT